MKQVITLLIILLLASQASAQDIFNRPKKYDVNITYQPSLPVFYASMLTEKKRQYDEGVHIVQEKINSVQETVSNLFNADSSPYEYLTTKINEEIKVVNTSNIDYSDPSVVSGVVSRFSRWEALAYKINREQKKD